uniref:Uncharacterized protein n=1 Tax=Caenorhabditis japonica TaxID=281687 RepID=A0A8R1EVN1_CAEJA
MVIGSISEEIHENHYNEIWAALQGSPEAITKIILRNSDPASGSIAGVTAENDDTEYDPEFKKVKTYDNLAPKTLDIEIFTQYTESELFGLSNSIGGGSTENFFFRTLLPDQQRPFKTVPFNRLETSTRTRRDLSLPRNIRSAHATAQIAFWQRNSQFHLTTDRGRKIIMEVDHSETVTGALRVHARFATVNWPTSKETMDLLNAQVTATQTKELHPGWLRLFPENDFLSGVPRDSSAWKLAKAVTDGGRLHRRPPCDTSLPQVCDFLNDPQREYCQMSLLDQNAATLANSPAGVGKTVMISAAAIAASSIFPGKLNIICGVTKASASEAVVKLAELEANNPVRFTRLISEQNRQRQQDSTHSDADYPELWKRVLAIALRRSADSALNGCRFISDLSDETSERNSVGSRKAAAGHVVKRHLLCVRCCHRAAPRHLVIHNGLDIKWEQAEQSNRAKLGLKKHTGGEVGEERDMTLAELEEKKKWTFPTRNEQVPIRSWQIVMKTIWSHRQCKRDHVDFWRAETRLLKRKNTKQRGEPSELPYEKVEQNSAMVLCKFF